MIPFIGFAPDLDPTTPGVITSCANAIPTLKGMKGAPSLLDAGLSTLSAACRGAALVTRLDNVRRVLAGTQTKLYELTGTTFTDVSRAGNYTGSPENAWRFAQFGNASLAANGTERIQVSTASAGAFADISQAPIAKIIETASGFVLAFNTNTDSDGWACSHIYDHLTWTPASSNQAANGRLLDTSGEIRAAKRLGQDVVVYKERSMYLGRYVGPPVVWSWQLIASDVGAISNESVIDTGTAHLFIGRDDFWLFDGSRPVSIGAPIKEWFFNNTDNIYRYRIRSYYDKVSSRAWWFYPTPSSGGVLTEALVYNLKTNKWGRATLSIEAVIDYQAAETTWDNWPPGPATTYEDIPDLPFDSPAFDTDSQQIGVFGTDNKVYTLSGPCASANIVTGDFGDDSLFTTLTAVKPRFIQRPTASSVTHYTSEYLGGSQTLRCTSALSGNKYDVLHSDRYHRLSFNFTGDFEMVGYTPDLVEDGEA